MADFYERHHGEVTFEVVSGGMITGERIGPIGEVASYIKWAYKEVEQRCGVAFGQAFLEEVLEEGSAVFTSVPAAIALAIVKEEQPQRAVSFAGTLQKAIYYDGIRPLDLDAYAARAEAIGFDRAGFRARMEEGKYQDLARADFARSRQAGITGFPTVIGETEAGKRYALARGYVDRDRLEEAFGRLQQLSAKIN